jgi:hypothetical protein
MPGLESAFLADLMTAVRLALFVAGLTAAVRLAPKMTGCCPSPDPIPPNAYPPTMTTTAARRIYFPPNNPVVIGLL